MSSDYLKRLDVQGYLRVKRALVEWDPTGVLDAVSDWPDDEYDAYTAPVVRLLDQGASKEEILTYLRICCEEAMCVGFDHPKASRIVDELIAFWPQWKKQLHELGPDHQVE